ncbi:MAG: alpha/beta hydrolase [Actinomycetota bacterium]
MRWRTMTPGERERAYSPSSVLPDGDYGPFVAAYRRESDEAWTRVRATAGATTVVLPYGDRESQTIDVAVPAAAGTPVGSADAGAPPLLAFIHGGYWQELSKLDSRFAAADCVDRGWAFAAIDYTLAPDATVDEIVDECRRAMRSLHAAADELGVDPGRIVVSGSSAGAHLAAMAALDPVAPAGHLAAAVLLSGVYELEPLIGTSIDEAVALDVETAHRLSPLRADLDGFPPTLVVHGENETTEFVAQSHAMADALRLVDVPVSTLEIPDRNHFDVVLALAQRGTRLGDSVAELVEHVTRRR